MQQGFSEDLAILGLPPETLVRKVYPRAVPSTLYQNPTLHPGS